MSHTNRNKILTALGACFPATIPVMAGYVFLGITYGILMVTSGFPVWLPTLTALVIYTGSMEFLMVQILASSFHPLSALATAVMVGARHIFYGISMLGKYRDMGWKKPYLIYTTSDETFAVNYSAEIPDHVDRGWYFLLVSFLDQMYWVIGTTLGALFGSFITFNTKGLDFVMTAMFAVIFMNQWTRDTEEYKTKRGTYGLRGFIRAHISELVGLFSAGICLMIFGPDRFIIPTMISILALLAILRGKLDPVQDEPQAPVQDGPQDPDQLFPDKTTAESISRKGAATE